MVRLLSRPYPRTECGTSARHGREVANGHCPTENRLNSLRDKWLRLCSCSCFRHPEAVIIGAPLHFYIYHRVVSIAFLSRVRQARRPVWWCGMSLGSLYTITILSNHTAIPQIVPISAMPMTVPVVPATQDIHTPAVPVTPGAHEPSVPAVPVRLSEIRRKFPYLYALTMVAAFRPR